MTTPAGADDEFSELVDARIPRVDLVDKAANGLPFLLAKQADGAAGLFHADFVRDLLAKSAPEHEPTETVTMTGSPGAIARLIHEAAGRAGTEPAAGDVAKEADASAPGELDPTVVLAEPDQDAPGDPQVPGSPAWEAIDAATATKWTAILARAQRALGVLAERELLEPLAGDPDDYDAVMDLGDASCAVEYAISLLAPYAVAEQAEASTATDETAAVGKALHGWNPEPLDTIEALDQVRKAGRVLSTSNEAAIRGAVEQLQKVLASLPAAPTAPETTEEGDRTVAKQEEPMPTATPPAPAATGAHEPAGDELAKGVDEPVAKADKVPQVAVYDQSGKLVGIVDPDDIVMIAQAEPEPEAAPEDPAEPEPDADAPDLAPAPPAEAGTRADAVPDDVAKESNDTPPDDVLKSIATAAATAALADYSATQEQVIAKQAADLAELADVVETLKGQVLALEEQPAVPGVFTNGAVPPANQLRGQDRGAPAAGAAVAQDLKKGLYTATDATEQRRIADDMQGLAIARLQEIHSGGAR